MRHRLSIKSLRFVAWFVKSALLFAIVLPIGLVVLRWFGLIYAVSLGFLIIAIAIVFVAVFSKAYRNWPV